MDFDAFIRFLKAHGHNCTLLWYTELPRFHGLPTTDADPPDFTVGPHPWLRTGPGLATDGEPKFDLTKFNPEYFDRLRTRVQALGKAGIYVGVYLFTGEWVLRFRCPADGYPFSGPNNINGADDGYRDKSSAVSSVTMTAPNAITGFQDVYVKKMIDTLNDLPNVLWIVSEEAPTASTWWNDHLISVVRAYEKGKPFQHPIGYATLGEQPNDSILYNSDADWVAPWARVSPTKSTGTGSPSAKVIINDSDHSYYRMWDDTPQKNRNYIWENFANGSQVLFMDPYLVNWPKWKRNLCLCSGSRHRHRARPTLRQLPGQSGLPCALLAQAQPGRGHSQGRTLVDGLLSRPDPRRRGGVPRLRPRRGLVHAGPLRHAELPEPCRRMVRPGEREDDYAKPSPRRIVLTVVPRTRSAAMRCCTLWMSRATIDHPPDRGDRSRSGV